MKKLFLIAMLSMIAFIPFAQISGTNTITGKIIDADTKLPLEYSTVSVFLKNQLKPITGTTSNKSGYFAITDLAVGTFSILIENIGYTPYKIDSVVFNKNDDKIELKTLSLKMFHKDLSSVTVISKSSLIDNKIDKLVFNAEKDITSQVGDATDILKKIPQVSVDIDGNVQLAGNSGIRFLINGKPSAAFGNNMADVLQSIPASQIKSVEVITNPGAKYDAEGMGGIINIIMKSNTSKGYSGSVSATAGTRMENTALNFGIRKKKISFNVFFSGNKKLPGTNLTNSYRTTNNDGIQTTLEQHNRFYYERHGFQSGIGTEWTLNKMNSISGNISFNNFGNSFTSDMDQSFQSGTTNTLSLLNSYNKVAVNTLEFSVLYKKRFKKEEQTLDFKANTSNSDNTTHSDIALRSKPENAISFGTISLNPATIKLSELAVDFANPIKKNVKIGLGSKVSFFDISSHSSVDSYHPTSGNYLRNDYLSSLIHYQQKIYAGYGEISFPVSTFFETKFGGRFERTEINSNYSNVTTQVEIPNYNTFVPSVYLLKKINEKNTFKVSYTKRIQRPDYEGLNPFINTIDPKNISTGNPYLKPEMAHRFELSYSKDLGKLGSFMITSFYRINYDDIQQFITYYPSLSVGDSTYTNVALTTRENIGEEKNIGLDLFEDLRFSTKFNLRSNISLFYRNTIDSNLNTNSLNYRFNINATYQFSSTLTAEFFGNINSPRNEAQGRYPSFSTYNIGMRKQLWKKKGSIAITSNSLFSKYLNMNTSVTGANFFYSSERKILFRSIGVNFVWKFGKIDFKKNPIENDMNSMAQ